jgi:LmbE family N-acetylglucosaminyl deacetylase
MRRAFARFGLRALRSCSIVLARRYRPCGSRCLVLAPHPDDETLGCGGTIAALTSSGVDVHVVIATDGTGSDRLGRRPEIVRTVRRREALAACRVLGVPEEHVTFLDFPDGQLAGYTDELVACIDGLVREIRPEHLLVCSALDPHPDHVALRNACDPMPLGDILLFEYVVWAWRSWPRPAIHLVRSNARARRDIPPGLLQVMRRHRRVAVGKHRDTKRCAFECYDSQMGDGALGRGLPPSMIEDHLGRYELLVEVRSSLASPGVTRR